MSERVGARFRDTARARDGLGGERHAPLRCMDLLSERLVDHRLRPQLRLQSSLARLKVARRACTNEELLHPALRHLVIHPRYGRVNPLVPGTRVRVRARCAYAFPIWAPIRHMRFPYGRAPCGICANRYVHVTECLRIWLYRMGRAPFRRMQAALCPVAGCMRICISLMGRAPIRRMQTVIAAQVIGVLAELAAALPPGTRIDRDGLIEGLLVMPAWCDLHEAPAVTQGRLILQVCASARVPRVRIRMRQFAVSDAGRGLRISERACTCVDVRSPDACMRLYECVHFPDAGVHFPMNARVGMRSPMRSCARPNAHVDMRSRMRGRAPFQLRVRISICISLSEFTGAAHRTRRAACPRSRSWRA